MSIDALAFEPQFLDHIAPVWRALPAECRGRLLVDEALGEQAREFGLETEPVVARDVRRSSLPPTADPGQGPIAFATSIGDIKIGRRLGYHRFVFMEHGAGQAYAGDRSGLSRHPSYAGGADREDVGLFLVPNDYSADLWRRAYPAAAVEVVGCPKLDELPERRIDPIEPYPVVAISFHWPAFVAPESGTAVGHYLHALPELARRWKTIGHAHPKADWPQRMARIYRRAGIEFVASFEEVCRRADVYVCDNSSTLFEFAATDRPVVVLNAPQFRRNVHHGLRFWDAADVGVQVDGPAELVAAIERALRDPEDQRLRREAALDIVYRYRTGGAERAAAAITRWLGARVEVAA
jgi:CDP-Glycerol:Poly(glycerophosphate) glycerophosphotransferase